MRKYIVGTTRKPTGRVSVQLNSPPIRDLPEESLARARDDKHNQLIDRQGSEVDEEVSTKTEQPVEDVQDGSDIDDLLNSDDDCDGERTDVCSGLNAGSGSFILADVAVGLDNRLFEHSYPDDIDYEENDIGESVGPHLIWANACTYSCQACGEFVTNDQAQFVLHLKARHSPLSRLTAYKRVHGEPFKTVKHVKCALCGTLLVQDQVRLRGHLHQKHRPLTLQEYYEQYVVRLQQDKGHKELASWSLPATDVTCPEEEVEEEEVVAEEEEEMGVVSSPLTEANPNREDDCSQDEEEEERKLKEYKDWVDKCQIR